MRKIFDLLWVDTIFDKSKFVLAQDSFINESSFSEAIRSEIIDRILSMSAASECQSLHVSSLSSSESNDVL